MTRQSWFLRHLRWLLYFCLIALCFGKIEAQTAQTLDVDTLNIFIESQLAAHRIPGLALAITQGDEIVHVRGYGTAGNGRSMTADTPMHIGSVSKSFTALAIMQLAEQGLVDLDAPVQTYLPWFTLADAEAAQSITIRHLLHHTSGLSDLEYVPTFPEDTTLREAVADLQRLTPTAEVGERFYYFNQNYSTLGVIVETISGQSYGDYVEKHIFNPLDMTQSSAKLSTTRALNVAQGHNIFFGTPIAREQAVANHMMPEGGIAASAEDMAHYLIALNNGGVYQGKRILSEEGIRMMHTPGSGTNGSYGMGWDIGEFNGRRLVYHGGLMDNFLADATLAPDEGFGTILLINQSGLIPAIVALPQIQIGLQEILNGQQPSSGLSVSTVYWILVGVVLATVFFDIRWWRRNFPAWRKRVSDISIQELILGVGRELVLPAILFFGVPALLVALQQRGMTWGRIAGLTPDLFLLLWYGILMGVAKSVGKGWSALRQRRVAPEARRALASSVK